MFNNNLEVNQTFKKKYFQNIYQVIVKLVVAISVPVSLVVDGREDEDVEDEERAADGDGHAQRRRVV